LFEPTKSCVVIFKDGKLADSPRYGVAVVSMYPDGSPSSCETRRTDGPIHEDAIIMGIGYTGDNKRIIRVSAEDVPYVDALDERFGARVACLAEKYVRPLPEWLSKLLPEPSYSGA